MLPITEINVGRLLKASILDNPFNSISELSNTINRYCNIAKSFSSFQITMNDYEIKPPFIPFDPAFTTIKNIASNYMQRANIKIDDSICTIKLYSYNVIYDNVDDDDDVIEWINEPINNDKTKTDDQEFKYCIETCIIFVEKGDYVLGCNFVYFTDKATCFCINITNNNIINVKKGDVFILNGSLPYSHTKYLGHGDIQMIKVHFKSLERA